MENESKPDRKRIEVLGRHDFSLFVKCYAIRHCIFAHTVSAHSSTMTPNPIGFFTLCWQTTQFAIFERERINAAFCPRRELNGDGYGTGVEGENSNSVTVESTFLMQRKFFIRKKKSANFLFSFEVNNTISSHWTERWMNRQTKRVAVTMGTTKRKTKIVWARGSIAECVVTNVKKSFFRSKTNETDARTQSLTHQTFRYVINYEQ